MELFITWINTMYESTMHTGKFVYVQILYPIQARSYPVVWAVYGFSSFYKTHARINGMVWKFSLITVGSTIT